MLRGAATAWASVEQPPTDQWCERELRIPPEFGADPGPFDLLGRPYWREPLQMMDDPEVFIISLMSDAQRGKTVALMAMLLSRSYLDPAPSMLAGPDQDSMREARDKVYWFAQASPAMERRVPPQRLWNDRFVDLMTMYVYLAYSGSKQRLRGRTCKYVFATEVDVWQDDPRLGQSARLIRSRVKAYPEHKFVFESTPTDEVSTIDAMNRAGDQRKFNVPCPHCGHHQELRFFPHKAGPHAGCGGIAGMQDEKDNWLAPEEARKGAYYLCEKGCRIESTDKAAVLARGQWVPRGQHIDDAGNLVGTPAKSKRHVSYHLSALYDEQTTFGDVAAEYLEARESNALREFFNNWLGLKYISGTRMPNWKVLGRRLAGTHRRGRVPAEAWFLTASADVQADRVYWVVRAWGDRCRSWLIDWGVLQRTPNMDETGLVASDLAQLDDAVLKVRWPVEGVNPRGLTELPVRVLGVDAGHRIQDVHAFLRAHPGDRVRAIHGDDKVDPAMGYRMMVVERNARTGKPYEGGLELWGIYVNVYKQDLMDRFSLWVEEPGAWLLPCNVFEGGEDYLRQLVNEGPVVETMPSGRKVVRWVTRDKRLGEHFWDDEVYNRCLADMVTGGNWDARTWPRPKQKPPVEREGSPREDLGVVAREDVTDLSARD